MAKIEETECTEADDGYVTGNDRTRDKNPHVILRPRHRGNYWAEGTACVDSNRLWMIYVITRKRKD